jgi:hypothetical protein
MEKQKPLSEIEQKIAEAKKKQEEVRRKIQNLFPYKK